MRRSMQGAALLSTLDEDAEGGRDYASIIAKFTDPTYKSTSIVAPGVRSLALCWASFSS